MLAIKAIIFWDLVRKSRLLYFGISLENDFWDSKSTHAKVGVFHKKERFSQIRDLNRLTSTDCLTTSGRYR